MNLKSVDNGKRNIIIIAGEVSGDIHAAKLILELKIVNPHLLFHGIGGDRMMAAGLNPIYHIKDMAFLGLSEVIKHLPFIRKVFKRMKRLVKEINPDMIILVDYPGFNLRFARMLSGRGIPIVYYISPQLWAWGKRRIKKIKKFIDQMLVILPFEYDFYRQQGIKVQYVGHPLVDEHFVSVSPKKITNNSPKILGLLPGSRKHEIEQLLPVMLNTVDILHRSKKINKVFVAKVKNVEEEFYHKFIEDAYPYVFLSEKPIADFYNSLDAALVKSGTSTLECGYFKVPMVVVYKVNKLTWYMGRLMVKLKNIGLVNIVAGKQVAVELLQDDFTAKRAADELAKLFDIKTNEIKRRELKIISEKLGDTGASKRAAEAIISQIEYKEKLSDQ